MSDELLNLKDTFVAECYELLENMEKDLLELDSSNADNEVLHAIFRGAHSMKGGAAALGFNRTFTFTHSMETLLDVLREGKLAPSQDIIDVLLAGVDIVRQIVELEHHNSAVPAELGQDVLAQMDQFTPGEGGAEEEANITTSNTQQTNILQTWNISFKPHRHLFVSGNDPLFVLKQLQSIGDMHAIADISTVPDFDNFHYDECHLSWDITLETDKGEAAIRDTFEFVEDSADISVTTTSTNAPVEDTPLEKAAPLPEQPIAIEKDKDKDKDAANATNSTASVRVDTIKIDKMVNMVGELVIAQSMFLAQAESHQIHINRKLSLSLNDLSRRTRELQEAVMAIRMHPVRSVFSRMNRLVRDLSRQLNKPIRLVTFGEATEVDKTIIEKLSDPITHMIRNSADHGLESPEKRTQNGKPAEGTISLSAYNLGSKIIINVEDDGAGINREKVLEKAISKGLVPANASLSPSEIDALIFAPGFSTADNVSAVSGRGVGMDVVDRNIKELGGNIITQNYPGQGAKFTIVLPLTLAILDGMVVSVGGERYIVPVTNILETLRPHSNNIKTIAEGNDILNIRGEFIPIIYLGKLFHIPDAIEHAHEGLVIIIETGRNKYGLVVDSLLGQQQVVIKTIDDNKEPIRGVSGATILGNGKVSLILDIAEIYQMLGTSPSISHSHLQEERSVQ